MASYGGRRPQSPVLGLQTTIGIFQFAVEFLFSKMENQGKSTEAFEYKVYLLSCNDGSVYTGCTSNLDARLLRHQNGQVPSTIYRRPVELLTYVAFPDKYRAYRFEKYLKSGSGRAFLKRHLV